MRKKEWIRLAFGLGLLLGAAASAAAAESTAEKAERGEAVFQQNCSGCHTIGGDRPTGPDLAGVTERRDRQWLLRIILEPDRLIAEGDPTIRKLMEKYPMAMPDVGLTEEEAEAVLTFLQHPLEEQHQAGETAAAKGKTTEEPAGDPQHGRDLYVGTAAFENGGAPCLACHGIAGEGLGRAAGASFGADLTNAYQSYEREGLLEVLDSIPFPSMAPIYSEHPLTDEEQRDITAFLGAISGTPPKIAGVFALDAGIAAAALFGLALLFGWRRLKGVRRPLVAKTLRQSRREAK